MASEETNIPTPVAGGAVAGRGRIPVPADVRELPHDTPIESNQKVLKF